MTFNPHGNMKFKQALEAAATGVRNTMLGANLASLTLLHRPEAMIRYIADSLFLFSAMSSRRALPQKNVFEALGGDNAVSITLGSLDSFDAWFWPQALYTQDIVSLCLICQIVKPKLVFEIGTLNGYTAYHCALNTPADSRILTLDLPPGEAVSANLYTSAIDDLHIYAAARAKAYCFDHSEVADKITCLFGDSAAFDYSPYHGEVDFFFIDGAHSFEYARSDTLNALRCCHPGSVIAWHDYGKASVIGVSKWLAEFAQDRAIYSIPGGSLAYMVVE